MSVSSWLQDEPELQQQSMPSTLCRILAWLVKMLKGVRRGAADTELHRDSVCATRG